MFIKCLVVTILLFSLSAHTTENLDPDELAGIAAVVDLVGRQGHRKPSSCEASVPKALVSCINQHNGQFIDQLSTAFKTEVEQLKQKIKDLRANKESEGLEYNDWMTREATELIDIHNQQLKMLATAKHHLDCLSPEDIAELPEFENIEMVMDFAQKKSKENFNYFSLKYSEKLRESVTRFTTHTKDYNPPDPEVLTRQSQRAPQKNTAFDLPTNSQNKATKTIERLLLGIDPEKDEKLQTFVDFIMNAQISDGMKKFLRTPLESPPYTESAMFSANPDPNFLINNPKYADIGAELALAVKKVAADDPTFKQKLQDQIKLAEILTEAKSKKIANQTLAEVLNYRLQKGFANKAMTAQENADYINNSLKVSIDSAEAMEERSNLHKQDFRKNCGGNSPQQNANTEKKLYEPVNWQNEFYIQDIEKMQRELSRLSTSVKIDQLPPDAQRSFRESQKHLSDLAEVLSEQKSIEETPFATLDDQQERLNQLRKQNRWVESRYKYTQENYRAATNPLQNDVAATKLGLPDQRSLIQQLANTESKLFHTESGTDLSYMHGRKTPHQGDSYACAGMSIAQEMGAARFKDGKIQSPASLSGPKAYGALLTSQVLPPNNSPNYLKEVAIEYVRTKSNTGLTTSEVETWSPSKIQNFLEKELDGGVSITELQWEPSEIGEPEMPLEQLATTFAGKALPVNSQSKNSFLVLPTPGQPPQNGDTRSESVNSYPFPLGAQKPSVEFYKDIIQKGNSFTAFLSHEARQQIGDVIKLRPDLPASGHVLQVVGYEERVDPWDGIKKPFIITRDTFGQTPGITTSYPAEEFAVHMQGIIDIPEVSRVNNP